MVYMVNKLTGRDVSVRKTPCDVVHQNVEKLPAVGDGSLNSANAIVMGVPKNRSGFFTDIPVSALLSSWKLEVVEWSILPEYLSAFRVVRKSLAEIFQRWHVTNRRRLIVHGFYGFGFRAGTGSNLTGSNLLLQKLLEATT